jgi:hypothetical protein
MSSLLGAKDSRQALCQRSRSVQANDSTPERLLQGAQIRVAMVGGAEVTGPCQIAAVVLFALLMLVLGVVVTRRWL